MDEDDDQEEKSSDAHDVMAPRTGEEEVAAVEALAAAAQAAVCVYEGTFSNFQEAWPGLCCFCSCFFLFFGALACCTPRLTLLFFGSCSDRKINWAVFMAAFVVCSFPVVLAGLPDILRITVRRRCTSNVFLEILYHSSGVLRVDAAFSRACYSDLELGQDSLPFRQAALGRSDTAHSLPRVHWLSTAINRMKRRRKRRERRTKKKTTTRKWTTALSTPARICPATKP